ncbi:aminotransferase class V-fold PLP-dependent enzyme [Alkalihalobacillus sp. LMS6]|uniref:aminotransferase class V-fold PLP-dependent enzyme n=1 Tax=Alkalihalobacillus sp. LMS6 TaxID=2924034 RepID=UPI0020D1EE9B|nr:aminotransferase class V-fold PLP-dependent enzyme [Alkalihalobacillus sp. LMS6]UTR06480.1 aminotransferase class V-fold PLP-dependent enzyme [Alkalihalobacillus sp. LMS6]
MYYFDQAATSFPKPKSVIEAVANTMEHYGANPGRSGHLLSRQAAEIVQETREKVASFFHAPAAEHVWFYANATYALNQAILGFPFDEGDEVVTSYFEHNSVLRPLYTLESKGIELNFAGGKTGEETADAIVESITERTRFVVINHASNVTGDIVPLSTIAQKAHAVGAILCVDASQTAGVIDIDMDRDGIDLLACPGHKGLLGPQGTGMLVSKKDYQLKPLTYGGTGHTSESKDQPHTWPERYEAGTLNTPALAGLGAGLDEIEHLGGTEAIYKHEMDRLDQLLTGLKNTNVTLVGTDSTEGRLAVVSFGLPSMSSQEIAIILDQHYQIAVRAGLHCAPKLHEWYGSIDEGLVRVSFGPYTTKDEVDLLLQAIQDISEAM